ncbi:MAG: ATP-grasp domain-containing protein [Planctomycetota bacterium]
MQPPDGFGHLPPQTLAITDQNDTATVLVIAASGRAAAESLRRAGEAPRTVDLFGDRETRAASVAWESLTSFRDRLCRDAACQASAPDSTASSDSRDRSLPYVLGGGLLGDPSWLTPLVSRNGLPPSELRTLKDPSFLKQLACDAQVDFPETFTSDEATSAGLDTRLETHRDWLIKPRFGTGGIGIRRLNPQTAPLKRFQPDELLQRSVGGKSIGVSFVGDGSSAVLLGMCRLLRRRPARGQFVFAGAIGPLDCSPDLRQKLQGLGETLVQTTSICGPFNIDVQVGPRNEVTLLEVNPRYSASMELIELHWQRRRGQPCSVFDSLRRWQERTLGGSDPRPQAFVKRILYATDGRQLTPDEFDQYARRSDLPAGAWFTDTPATETSVQAGEPMATLIAPCQPNTLRDVMRFSL